MRNHGSIVCSVIKWKLLGYDLNMFRNLVLIMRTEEGPDHKWTLSQDKLNCVDFYFIFIFK